MLGRRDQRQLHFTETRVTETQKDAMTPNEMEILESRTKT